MGNGSSTIFSDINLQQIPIHTCDLLKVVLSIANHRISANTMENLERQLEEIEVLEAIYPDEMAVDECTIEPARNLLENYRDGPGDDISDLSETRLSFTMSLARLECLERNGKLKHIQPSITIEFPHGYPENSPPLVIKASGLDTELMKIVQTFIDDHSGEESMMQLVVSINEEIQIRNESTIKDFETEQTKRQQESGPGNILEAVPDSKPIIGRRIINSAYILKPAKIKDIKKCADELRLGGYAKVGKPGIIVIEGPEEGCKRYCPMLEDRGWKYQKVQGEETEEGQAGGTVDDLRVFRKGSDGESRFEVLAEHTTVSELGRLCREAGLADFFFTSLNIHDSSSVEMGTKASTNDRHKNRKD